MVFYSAHLHKIYATALMSCTELCASWSASADFTIQILTREATFSRNNLNILSKIALSVRLVRLFATKFVLNEIWIILEHTYLLESQEKTILSQHLSSLFVVLLGEVFRNSCGQLIPWRRRHRFTRHLERNVASPYLAKMFLRDSHGQSPLPV